MMAPYLETHSLRQIDLEILILLMILMEMEIGFILVPTHFLLTMEMVFAMRLLLVFGQNHLLIQQWIYLLMVGWSIVAGVITVQL